MPGRFSFLFFGLLALSLIAVQFGHAAPARTHAVSARSEYAAPQRIHAASVTARDGYAVSATTSNALEERNFLSKIAETAISFGSKAVNWIKNKIHKGKGAAKVVADQQPQQPQQTQQKRADVEPREPLSPSLETREPLSPSLEERDPGYDSE